MTKTIWGARLNQAVDPGSVVEVSIERKDGSGEVKTVKVFYKNEDEGYSLGNFFPGESE